MALTFGYSLEFHGRDAIVDGLFLVEGARKRGIGTMALTFMSEECRALGIHALHLEVEHSNEAGLALYGKLGFKAHVSRYLMTRWIEDNRV
jgi:GNAT superfamily N-acetyltransferase